MVEGYLILGSFSHFIMSAQASGAQVEVFGLAIDNDGGRVHVGYPGALGMALGVADIITGLRYFPAQITFQSQFSFN